MTVISLRDGEKTSLYLQKYGPSPQLEEFKGFYLGKKPVKTDWLQKIDSPEGHVFARMTENGPEIYCTRTEKINLIWGVEDGSSFPLGINVVRIGELELTKNEKKHLTERLGVWEAKPRRAQAA